MDREIEKCVTNYLKAFEKALKQTGQSPSAWRASNNKALALVGSQTNLQPLSNSPIFKGISDQVPSTRMAEKPSPATAAEPSSQYTANAFSSGSISARRIPHLTMH